MVLGVRGLGDLGLVSSVIQRLLSLFFVFSALTSSSPVQDAASSASTGLQRGRLMMRREAVAANEGGHGGRHSVDAVKDDDLAGDAESGSFYTPDSLLAKLVSSTKDLGNEAHAGGPQDEENYEDGEPPGDGSFAEEEEADQAYASSGSNPYATLCAEESGVCTCKGNIYFVSNPSTMDSEDLKEVDFTSVNSDKKVICSKAQFNNFSPRPSAQASCFCEAYEYFQYDYGKGNACDKGMEVKSQEECAFAASQLGIKNSPSMTWTKIITGSSIRSGCNLRDPNSPGEKAIYPVVWASNGVSFVQEEEGEGDGAVDADGHRGNLARFKGKQGKRLASKNTARKTGSGIKGRGRHAWRWWHRHHRRRVPPRRPPPTPRRRRTRRRRTRRRYEYRRRRDWHRRRAWDRRRDWHRRRATVQPLTKDLHMLICRYGRSQDGHDSRNFTASYCAKEGATCECSGTVYFGKALSQLKVKDIITGPYKMQRSVGSISCMNSIFGDPKPYSEKVCYCSEDWTDTQAAAASTCTKKMSTGSIWSSTVQSLHGNSAKCGLNQYMREFNMLPQAVKTLVVFDYLCCNYTVASTQPASSGRCFSRVSSTLGNSEYFNHLWSMPRLWMKCEPGTALSDWQFDSTPYANKGMGVKYTCCEPPSGRSYGRCTEIMTKRAAQQTETRSLGTWPAACPAGSALTGWALQHDSAAAAMFGRSTCCQIIEVKPLGEKRSCSWQGFPHVLTFDGKAAEFEQVTDKAYVTWLVSSPEVRIQVKVSNVGTLTYVTELAVAGDFLGNATKLIIKKEGLINKVLWGGVAVVDKLVIEGVGSIGLFTGTQVRATGASMEVQVLFTGFVELNVIMWDVNIDGVITMLKSSGLQSGHCGNDNGEDVDDTVKTWKVTKFENLFAPGETAGITGDAVQTLDKCAAGKLKEAQTNCGKSYKAAKNKQEFIDMCVWDWCFNAIPQFQARDLQDQEVFQQVRMTDQPRTYRLVDGAFNYGAALAACPPGTYLAKITSAAEQQAAVQAAQAAGTAFVWLGGRKIGTRWTWDDGTDLNYANWLKSDTESEMCMITANGLWFGCKYFTTLPALCVDIKSFALASHTLPHQMRDACGKKSAPAMIKSASEQAAANKVLSQHFGLLWLGAEYVRVMGYGSLNNPFWMWLDTSTVMGYTNWEAGQPDYTLREYDQLFLCARAETGKWRVCPSGITKQAVLCQSEVPSVCTPGMLKNREDLLLTMDGMTVSDVHDGHCFYLAAAGEDCSRACSRQAQGVCDDAGMASVTQSLMACKNVVEQFEMSVPNAVTHQYEIKGVERSCNYVEQSATSKRVIFTSGSSAASCSSKPADSFTHRVCSCKIRGADYPTSYTLQMGDVAHITASGFTNQTLMIAIQSARNECTTPQTFDPTNRSFSSKVGDGDGRLGDGTRMWSPTTTDANQWYEIDAGSCMYLTGVVTRGQGYGSSRTTEFSVSYSIDKKVYIQIDKNLTYDFEQSDTPVDFDTPVLARYVRIVPSKWAGGIAMKVGLRKCPGTDTLALAVNPQNKSMGWCVGAACNYIAIWPFDANNKPFTIDLQEGVDSKNVPIFQVKVNGVCEKALDRSAQVSTGTATLLQTEVRSLSKVESPGSFGLVTASGAISVTVSLERPQTDAVSVPVSMDSINGVMPDDYECFKKDVATFNFKITLTAGGTAIRCIYCEAVVPSLDVGNHILVQDRQIVVDIEGNTPRRQTFQTKLTISQTYNITISYVKADKTLDLYIGNGRVESLKYTAVKGTGISLAKGFLGGWNANHHLLAGSIVGFTLSHDIPQYRPPGESCATFSCPANWTSKPLAPSLQCQAQACDATKDLLTCCDEVGTCSLFTWCPINMVRKQNRQNIKCKDKTCEETDFSVCCDPKGMCSTTKCKQDTMNIFRANVTHCITSTCDDERDFKICCQPEAKCESLKCPDGYTQKTATKQLTCKGKSYCTNLLDLDTCCGKAGTCASFVCPTDMRLKAGAQSIPCVDDTCLDTPFETCCIPTGTCEALKCPADTILKGDADVLKCNSAVCNAAEDATQCCTKPAKCTGMSCGDGYVLVSNAEVLFCKGLRCSKAAGDETTCCTRQSVCTSVLCPDQYAHKWNAKDILCNDRTCKDEDFTRCCAEKGQCSTLKCADGYVQRDQAARIFCQHAKCDVSIDNDRCCIKKASCSQMACPVNTVLKPNAASLTCKQAQCTDDDQVTCCGEPGRCNRFTCPMGFSQRADAATLLCDDRTCENTAVDTCCVKDGGCLSFKCPENYIHRSLAVDLLCTAQKCGDPFSQNDTEMCCQKTARCNNLECPAPTVLKGNAAELPCASSVCTAVQDAKQCCDRQGSCSTFKCPINTLQKPDASGIYCDDKACVETSFTKCCAEVGLCSSMTCPAGYYSNPASQNSHCESFQCQTTNDRDKCCVPAAKCSTFACLAGWTLQPNPDTVFCGGRTCDEITDKTTCCRQEGKCTMYACPDKYVFRSNAKDIFCKDTTCKSTSYERCCVEEGICSSLQCPVGQVLKVGADNLRCKGFQCTGTDAAKCCTGTSVCNSGACLVTQVLRVDFAKHTCKSPVCEQNTDNNECCANKGFCTRFKCPDGFEHRHNASHTRCSDDECKTTDFNVCCVEEGTCSSYKCPANHVPRPGSQSTRCKGVTCAEVDTPRCCQEVATCGGFECPKGMTLKGRPTQIKCVGATCTKDDTETCCAASGRCDTMTCPESFQHVANAKDIWCDDPTCTKTDYNKCCAENGRCKTMQCPVSYMQRPNLTGIDCGGWTCSEMDRDRCCDRSAQCADQVCPFEKVLKSNATSRFCKGSTCKRDMGGATGCHKYNTSETDCTKNGCYWLQPNEHVDGEPRCTYQDIATCCAVAGTCSSMTCPVAYVHRANASNIFCSDKVCTQSDYAKCCIEQNHCLGYTCPKPFALKASAPRLFCKGASCTDSDRGLCCDPVATCNTLTCAAGRIRRRGAENIRCEGLQCTARDMGTCCEAHGTCSIFTCPYGWMKKVGAEKILCADSSCSDTAYETCCVQKAECTKMDCGIGYFARAASAKAYCAGAECNDADTPVCCDKQDNCGSYECPKPYNTKPRAQEILCNGRTCNDYDLHTCCGVSGTCSSYTCPADWTHRSNARYISCPEGVCDLMPKESCCAQVGRCSTFHCRNGLVPVGGSDTKQCQNGRCTIDDESTCCAPAVSCIAFSCPETHQLRSLAPNLFCKGANCSVTADLDTCCAKSGACLAYACNDGTAHRYNAGVLLCPGGNCTSKNDFCCAEAGTCPTLACPMTSGRIQSATNALCRLAQNGGQGPCTEADRGICCEPRMPCSKMTCPAGKVWREGYKTTFCTGTVCNAADDIDTCCIAKAPCSNVPCGFGGRPRFNATCGGATCTDADRKICCQQSCDKFVCPATFVNKTDMPKLLCIGETCKPGDELNCCDSRATCLSFGRTCPDKTVVRGTETLCKLASCTDEDQATCCAGTCSWLECPDATHVPKANGSSICASMTCNITDRATCCSTRATCDGFSCPADLVNRGPSVRCPGDTCNPADFKTCCATTCSQLKCIEGYVKKDGAVSKLCNGFGCSDPSDMQTCCDPAASCMSFNCEARGMSNRGTAVHCGASTCNSSDEAQCCLQTCSSYTCPPPYVKKPDPDTVACKSPVCNHNDDRDMCCIKRALCSTYECPADSVMLATDQYCAGSTCRAIDSGTCCKPASSAQNATEQVVLPVAAPAPCPPAQPQVKTASVQAVEATTTAVPPTDIIPQEQLNKKKRDHTITFFLVFCVIVLVGGLLALVAMTFFRFGTKAAAPGIGMAQPLQDGGDF